MKKQKRKKGKMTVITFQIGDWSGDGHGRCDDYQVTSNKPVKEVREAYFKALKKFPKCMSPENFMEEYEDYSLPKETYKAALEHGYDLLEGFKENDDFKERFDSGELLEYPDVGTQELLQYTLWFVMQGDPELQLKFDPERAPDTFAFYGSDEKGRHIGFIGYGLLGN